jgi:sugar lactone lactonase YvrE
MPVCGQSDNTALVVSGTPQEPPASTPVVSTSVNTSQIHEGVVARLIVTSSAASSFTLTPRFQAAPKKASKNDFGMSPARFIIPAGQSSASIDLHATADTLTEKNESVSIKLAKGPGYKVGRLFCWPARSSPRFRCAAATWLLTLVLGSTGFAQGTLIPVSNARAFAFDHSNTYIYIATTDGFVKRYNLTTGDLVTLLNLGGSLTTIDVASDDSFILVGQGVVVNSNAIFYRINLNAADIIEMTTPAESDSDGAFDLAISANGIALATTQIGFVTADLLQINLANNTITRRDDAGFAVPATTSLHIQHSADRKTLYLANDRTPATLFHADTNSFQTIGPNYGGIIAVNRDGTLLADNGVIDRTSDLRFLKAIRNDGGFVFDGRRDIIYVLDNPNGRITAYDTNTFGQLFRFTFPEQLGGVDNLVASDTGDYIALYAGSGIRVFKAPAVPPSPTPTPVPTTANRRDMVFNRDGTHLYIATTDGFVLRVNVAANAIDKVYDVGGALSAIDIAADDSFLLLAQSYTGIADGVIQRIDLKTDLITNLNYRLTDVAGAPSDLAIASNATVLFTTTAYPGPIGQLDLTTGEARARIDIATGDWAANLYGGRLERSADGSRLYFLETSVSPGSVFTYSAVDDTFSARVNSTLAASANGAAVNRSGTLLATRRGNGPPGISLDTPDLHFIRSLDHGDAGIAFDAITDNLYVIDATSSQVVAYDTNTLAERFRVNIGVSVRDQIGGSSLVASPDGNLFAVTTPTGVRILHLSSAVPSGTPAPPTFDFVRDMVFDHAGTHLYITSDAGLIWPFNLVTNTMDPPYVLSGHLLGADVSPDDSYLLVAQGAFGIAEGHVEKVNLNTREVTPIPYWLTRLEYGGFDVAIAANGSAFLTVDGAGLFPVRQLNLATNEIAIRPDVPGWAAAGIVFNGTQVHRSADRSRLYFMEGNMPFGPRFTYDSSTNQFGPNNTTGVYSLAGAVNRNGLLLASQLSSSVALDTAPSLSSNHIFNGPDGGVAFDAVADVLYAANSATSQVIVYDTNTFAEKRRLSIGESIPNFVTAYGPGYMVASQDGKYVALQTSQRIRLLNTVTGTSIPISPASATPIPTPTPKPTATPKPKPSLITVSVSPKQIVEGSDAVFTFEATPPLSAPSSVPFKISGGGGRNVSFDASISVFFQVGQSTTTASLHTTADNLKQGKQKFTVKLVKSPVPSYKNGNPKSATVTIVDAP